MRIFSYLIASLIFLGLSSGLARAESLNSWARGSSSQFSELLAKVESTRCDSAICPIKINPLVLTLKTPRSGILRVYLTSAELSAPVVDGLTISGSRDSTRRQDGPLLLRGWSIPVNKQDTSTPVAAVITRSSTIPILFISVRVLKDKQENSQVIPAKGLVSLRLDLKQFTRTNEKNARTEISSRYAFQDLSCAANHNQPSQHRSNTISSLDVTTKRSYPTLYVATDFDPQFSSKIRCSSVSACNDRIVKTLHTSAVFYENQLGYTLTVARQFGPTSIGGETKPEQVLDTAQQLSLLPRSQYLHTGLNTTENQVDIFQFFTGRTMDDKTIGIAYVGTACKNNQSEFSEAVVQNVSEGLNPVTAAHEIGHLLNASHTTSGIMKPNLGTDTPRSFSSSSLLEISTYLSAWYSECRQGFAEDLDTPTPTPTPKSSGSAGNSPYTGKPVTLALTVRSPAPKTIALNATVTSLSPQCSVIIRAGTTSFGAPRAKSLIQFTPSELSTTRSGAVRFKVIPKSSSGPSVFFVAEHTCADGTILEVSRVQRFNPNRIRGVSRSERSKKSWLDTLRRSLN